jgi:uncharacterized protein
VRAIRIGVAMNDRMGRTELHYAAVEGSADRVDVLLQRGADPDVPVDQGFTALHFAAQSHAVDVVERLLSAHAEVDPVNVHGNTPLGVATFHAAGRGKVIQLLLAAGADPDRANRAGVSPRQLAERIGNYDVARFFPRPD